MHKNIHTANATIKAKKKKKKPVIRSFEMKAYGENEDWEEFLPCGEPPKKSAMKQEKKKKRNIFQRALNPSFSSSFNADILKTIDFNTPTPKTGIDFFNRATITESKKQASTSFNGRTWTVTELYLEAIKLDKTLPEPYNNLAILLPKDDTITIDDKPWNKQELYLHAITLNPAYAFAYSNLGYTLPYEYCEESVLLFGKQWNNRELFARSAELDPNYPDAYYNLANTCGGHQVELFGKYWCDQQLYVKALDLGLSNPNAFYNLANTMSGKEKVKFSGKMWTVMDLYLKAVELHPGNANCYYHLANTASELGHHQYNNDDIHRKLVSLDGKNWSAVELYMKCLELDPQHSLAYSALASHVPMDGTVTFAGKPWTAVGLYIRAIELDNTDGLAYCGLAAHFIDEEQFDRVVSFNMNNAKQNDTTSPTTTTTITTTTTTTSSDPDTTTTPTTTTPTTTTPTTQQISMNIQQLCLKGVTLAPKVAWPFCLLAATLRRSNETIRIGEEAPPLNSQQLYIKALDIDPLDHDALFGLARTIPFPGNHSVQYLGRTFTEMDLYERAIKLFPYSAEAWCCLGNVLTSPNKEDIVFEGKHYQYNSTTEHVPQTATLDDKVYTDRDLYLRAIEVDPKSGYGYCCIAQTMRENETITLENSGGTWGKSELRAEGIKLSHFDVIPVILQRQNSSSNASTFNASVEGKFAPPY